MQVTPMTGPTDGDMVGPGGSYQVGRGGLLLHSSQTGECMVLPDGAHVAPLALLLLRNLAEALVLLVLAWVLPMEAAYHRQAVRQPFFSICWSGLSQDRMP